MRSVLICVHQWAYLNKNGNAKQNLKTLADLAVFNTDIDLTLTGLSSSKLRYIGNSMLGQTRSTKKLEGFT